MFGPWSYVIANHLGGIGYADFIERTVLLLMEEVPLNYVLFKVFTAVTMKSTIFQKIVPLNVREDMGFLHNRFSET
jgi:hypothetical protein